MATATSLLGAGRFNAFDTVSASTSDSALVSGVSGYKLRVVYAAISCGGTPSTVQFNSKPAGSSSVISPVFQNSIVLVEASKSGWFETDADEGLTVSTGAGSDTGILVVYERVKV